MIGDLLREPSARLELLDGLLEILTDVLDIREVSAACRRSGSRSCLRTSCGVLHILNEEEGRVRLHVTAGLPNGLRQAHESMTVSLDPDVLNLHSDPMVVDDVPSHPLGQFGPAGAAGLKSAIAAPFRFGGRLQAAVSVLSREPARFSSEDIPIAKRIASYIALSMSHEQLAEEARQKC